MRDIVERLRNWVPPTETHLSAPYELALQAADEIEELRAALSDLEEEALQLSQQLSQSQNYCTLCGAVLNREK